jgi:hypothetical protein
VNVSDQSVSAKASIAEDNKNMKPFTEVKSKTSTKTAGKIVSHLKRFSRTSRVSSV